MQCSNTVSSPTLLVVLCGTASTAWFFSFDSLIAVLGLTASSVLRSIAFVFVIGALLYVLMRQRAADIDEFNRRLDDAQRLSSIGELSSRISHDFRNVLMACRTFTDVLRRRHSSDPPELQVLANMQSALARGDHMVGEILGFASPQKSERGTIALTTW